MRTIHCPKDIGFTNTFEGGDCKLEQWYDDCYHCWTSAIAKNNQEYLQRKMQEKEEVDELRTLKEKVKALRNLKSMEAITLPEECKAESEEEMTLEEAIKHCEEVAERLENSHKRDWMCEDDKRCAAEHRQLAYWLKDYKRFLDRLAERL